ncbi:class I SAM-dependent methyltransferase [Pedobacter sp. GR22-10]|uniref:class I SAM-dependent methyltransferase n=1 Tax=Pedobacter sp. GR22-10 TaxID=2994472 RepID=UPI0022468699|nr:class I SAM-dependent methyltransferase [Pedobacter sp. GR22-10]MCX2431631.1 class I SAM-dependent methyltransferase [Pedobacter sp. GR22-10]
MEEIIKKLANRRNHEHIFTEIYKFKLWEAGQGEYYSGSGSHNPNIKEYVKIVGNLIKKMSFYNLVEIGCGDFFVTQSLLRSLDKLGCSYRYTGYDAVPSLIEKNIAEFQNKNVQFTCKDCAKQDIYSGDLLIIRQVLQHLDNRSILKILGKFPKFKAILVTEHQPSDIYGDLVKYNLDKTTNANIRVGNLSGVYLDKEPFNYSKGSVLHSFYAPFNGIEAFINTYLFSKDTLTLG